MTIIGLTGGIATGKDFAAKRLAEKGAIVICADTLGHALLEEHAVKKALITAFGKRIVSLAGTIDRGILSNIVFASQEKLGILNAIMHPGIVSQIKNRIQEALAHNSDAVLVINAAVLYEMKIDVLCDEIIALNADESKQIERCRQKGLSEKESIVRIKAQLSPSEYTQKADFVINNNSSLEELKNKIDNVWNEIIHPQENKD